MRRGELNSAPCVAVDKLPASVAPGFPPDASSCSRGDCESSSGAKIAGYPANFHVRDFLDCVKTRGKTRANADVACYSHITCNAANISLFLGRKVTYDPKKNEFPGDEEANRLRSEAQREPWRI